MSTFLICKDSRRVKFLNVVDFQAMLLGEPWSVFNGCVGLSRWTPDFGVIRAVVEKVVTFSLILVPELLKRI